MNSIKLMIAASKSIPEDVIEEIKNAEEDRNVERRLRDIETGVKKLYDWAVANQVGEGYELINPRTGEVAMKLNAYKVFNLIFYIIIIKKQLIGQVCLSCLC